MASPTASPPPSTTPPTTNPNTSAFRFKRKRPASASLSDTSTSKRDRSRSPEKPSHHHSHRHRHHHHHNHHRSRQRRSSSPHLDPDTAFRESLFDALADDEGAAFWESVYGQPIHTYSPYKPSHPSFPNYTNSNPEQESLQRMTDEEYSAYVRAKMWEKSHGYIIDERKRREEEKARRKKREEEGKGWQRGVEEALRRGEERRRKGRWKGVWEGYLAGWERLADSGAKEGKGKEMRERIPWPVESGKWEEVGKEEVERFFRHAPGEAGDLLKRQRVLWHPDKMLQRAGGAGIDEGTMRAVTAVFQVVDMMWSQSKGEGVT